MNNIDVLVQFNDRHNVKLFWKMWNKSKQKQYVRYVYLENKGKIYEKYEFNKEGNIVANKYIRIRLQGEW